MNVVDFHSWLQQRNRKRRDHVPTADFVMPVIAAAGRQGMTRSQIGNAIQLDRSILDDLLAALVELGLLTVSKQNGFQVFYNSGRSNFTKP
jgi:hypothetical protein